MSAEIFSILAAAAIILTIFVGTKYNLNLGILGLAFACLLGCFLLDLKPAEIYNMWPIKVTVQIIGITFFFGFVSETGSVKVIADYVMYLIQKKIYLLPIAAFFLSAVLSLCGVNPPAISAVLCPIFMSICIESGLSMTLIILAIGNGQLAGVISPVGQAGLVVRSYMETSLGVERTLEAMPKMYLNCFIVNLIIFIIGYVLLRGWNYKCDKKIVFKKPEINHKQRMCLGIMLLTMSTVLFPVLLSGIIKSEWISSWASKVDVGYIYSIAGLICVLLKLGDCKEVLIKHVPWRVVMVVGGMGCLLGVVNAGGAVELLSRIVQKNIPPALISPVMALFSGAMSMCSDSIGVVIPLMIPLTSAILGTTDVSVAAVCSAIALGALVAGVAPFSTGGALFYSFSPEKERKKIFLNQIIMAIGSICIVAVLSMTGLFG